LLRDLDLMTGGEVRVLPVVCGVISLFPVFLDACSVFAVHILLVVFVLFRAYRRLLSENFVPGSCRHHNFPY